MLNPAVTVLVPCHNNLNHLPRLLSHFDAMRATGLTSQWEILFINDGSDDGTGSLLNQLMDRCDWIRVVHHRKTRGLGAALRSGFERAEAPFLCTIACDGPYGPESLPAMVEALRHGADLVTVAVQSPGGGSQPGKLVREVANGVAARLYGRLLGGPAGGYSVNHRAYRTSVIKRIYFRSTCFLAVTEIMVRFLLQGFRVKAVPVVAGLEAPVTAPREIRKVILGHLGLLRMSCRILLRRTVTRWVASIAPEVQASARR
ncbi:MAG: glycosyltransferase family 2 protein [Acidobacteria bacterium]|nr:glycosyltransferase family 2 protein [Acidobacteriota bacterium]